jgi:hypothetical protein
VLTAPDASFVFEIEPSPILSAVTAPVASFADVIESSAMTAARVKSAISSQFAASKLTPATWSTFAM